MQSLTVGQNADRLPDTFGPRSKREREEKFEFVGEAAAPVSAKPGHVGGKLLNWVATLDNHELNGIAPQMQDGRAYGRAAPGLPGAPGPFSMRAQLPFGQAKAIITAERGGHDGLVRRSDR